MFVYPISQEDEEFVRTECYHYFHPSCLASYIKFCEAEECDLSRERSVQVSTIMAKV